MQSQQVKAVDIVRKRMKELAAGKIDYGKPLIRFSTDKVELEVLVTTLLT